MKIRLPDPCTAGIHLVAVWRGGITGHNAVLIEIVPFTADNLPAVMGHGATAGEIVPGIAFLVPAGKHSAPGAEIVPILSVPFPPSA